MTEAGTIAPPALPKVLIVEDEGLIALDIAKRLKKAGYDVVGIAESGAETLLMVEQLRPELILMDIRIKGDMDGVDTAEKIREKFDLPVIYLTAHSDSAILDRAKRTGPFGYLTKPLQQSSLQTSIEIALYKHRMERELREQRAWLTTILRTMGEAVAVTDRNQRVQFLNSGAEQLTGWTNDEAKRRALSEVLQIVDPEVGRLGDDVLAGLMLEDGPARLPRGLTAIDRKGRSFAIEGEIAPSLDNDEVLGGVITFRDGTNRQKEEQRVRQENKMQAVGRLAAGVAHDFNNVLGNILSRAHQVLQRSEIDSSTRSLVENILESAESAAAVTRQLLMLGQHELHPEPVDVNDIVAEAEGICLQTVGPRIMWRTELERPLGLINADSGLMVQVLANLVTNARDSMPNGGVVTVKTSNVEVPVEDSTMGLTRAYVGLEVKDTGTGMPPEVADQLFEPFFLAKGPGTTGGFGLAIVQGIVKDLNGTIDVQSSPGKGSTFTLYFPRIVELRGSKLEPGKADRQAPAANRK